MDFFETFLFSPWGMATALVIFVIIFKFIYSFTSSIGIIRQIMMIGGIAIYCFVGFANIEIDPEADNLPFIGADWWKIAGLIWLGATLYFMYLFADFSWEKHYYDEYRYNFIHHVFGSPEIEVIQDVREETHPLRWVLFSAFLGLGVMCLGEFLGGIIKNDFNYDGYLGCGIIGLAFLLIYLLRIVSKIVKSAKDR